MSSLKKIFLFLVLNFSFCAFLFAQDTYVPYPGARAMNNPFSDFPNFPPAFNCSFSQDFQNNFSIREAGRSPNRNALDFATPIVGDITGDGIPEILVLQMETQAGYGRPYFTSRTRNILVFRMHNGVLVEIGRIETPFVSIEGPTPFLIAKVPGAGNNDKPIIVVAASHDLDNNADASRLVAFQYSGGIVDPGNTYFVLGNTNRVWTSDQQYGRNVPISSYGLPFICLGNEVAGYCDEQLRYFRSGAAPAIADFDRNGVPEIYIYNEIFNAQTGAFIVDGGEYLTPGDVNSPRLGQGISQVSPGGGGEMFAGTMAVSVAADLNNNGRLELAAGNTVYLVDIAGKNMVPIMAPPFINGTVPRDGFTSIADIDGDGKLDIVVTAARLPSVPNSRQLYVWSLPGGPISTQGGTLITVVDNVFNSNFNELFKDRAISLAFIGNISSVNKKPYIGFTSGNNLWMYEYDGNSLIKKQDWPQQGPAGGLETNDRSGYTLITMFDFNQDGTQEIVYRDENKLRIMDEFGNELASFDSHSLTASEGAIIADVDLDGEAEIIVTDGGPSTVDGDRRASLVVYKSLTNPWAPARSVWNQYAYFSFNVNEDLSIPSPQRNHSSFTGVFFPNFNESGCLVGTEQPFNSFLVQTTLYNDQGCPTVNINLMDAKIEIRKSNFSCPAPDQKITITVIISNNSDAIGDVTAGIPTDTPISFFIDGVFIGSKTLSDLGLGEILPGQASPEREVTFDISVSDDLTGLQLLTASINFDYNTQDKVYDECDYTNNTSNEFAIVSRPKYTINTPAQCFQNAAGNLAVFNLLPVNTVTGAVESAQLKWFRDNTSGAEITGGTTADGVTYTIDPGDFSLDIIGLPASATPYTFVLLDKCTDLETPVQFKVDPRPSVAFVVQNATCFGGNDGRITSVTGHESYMTYSLDNGVTFIDINDLLARRFPKDTYSVTVKAELNAACVADFPFTIEEPIKIVFSSPEIQNPVCEPNNGAIFWNIAGGTQMASFPFYSYTLTKDGAVFTEFTVIEENGKNSIKGLTGGAYLLTATDQVGCPMVSEPFTLSNQEDPEFTVNSPAPICFGQDAVFEIEMTKSGAPAANPVYEWGKFSNGIFSPIATGQNIDGGVANIEENGRRLRITGLPVNGADYSYQVRITGNNTCNPVPLDTKIKVNPLPVLDPPAIVPVRCFGDSNGSITFTNNSGDPYSYFLAQLNLTVTDGVFINLPEGSYTVTVTNTTTNCQVTLAPILVPGPPALQLTGIVTVQPSCGQDNGSYSLDFQGGTPPYSLVITRGGAELETIAGISSGGNYSKPDLAPGDYVFTLTDANNCPIANSFTLTNDPKQSIGLVLTDVEICEGMPAKITPQIDTNGSPRTVTWFYDPAGQNAVAEGQDPNDAGISFQFDGENLVVKGIKNGVDKTYWLEVSGNLYCPILEPVKISADPPMVVSIEVPDVICFGGGVEITVTASGADGSYEYSFDGLNFQSSNIFNNVAAGDYTVTVRTPKGCTLIQDIEVEGPPAPLKREDDFIIIGPSCRVDNGSIDNVEISGGWGNYTFEWRKDDSINGTLVGTSIPKVDNLAAGTYYLIVTDVKGCKEIFEFEVVPQPLPDLVIADQTVCEGADITLIPTQIVSGASQTELIWYKDAAGIDPIPNGPDPALPQVIYTIDQDKVLLIKGLPAAVYTYYLKVVCSDEIKAVTVTVNAIPNPVFEKTDLLCFGIPTGKIAVTANGNPDFWYSVNGAAPVTQAVLEARDLPAGTYDITVTQLGTVCEFIAATIVLDEPDEFIFKQLDKRDPTCGSDDGMIQFSVTGGVKDYLITINNQPLTDFKVLESNGVYTVEDLALGSYDMMILDDNNCQLIELAAFALMDANPNAVLPRNLVVDICEKEEAVLLPDLTITGTVTPIFRWFEDAAMQNEILDNYIPAGTGVMFAIDAGSGQLTVYNLPLGQVTYYLEVSDPSDPLVCPVTSKADVTVFGVPAPQFSATDVQCFGDTNGKIKLIAGDDPQLRFSIDGAPRITRAQLVAMEFADGIYDIETFFGTSDCPDRQQITINPKELLVLTKGTEIDPTCDQANGSFSFTITGGTKPYQVLINNGPLTGFTYSENQGTYSFSQSLPGKYIVTVTDANGCVLPVPEDFDLTNFNGVPITAQPMAAEVCEGSPIVFVPDFDSGSVVPLKRWFSDADQNQEILSNYNPLGTGMMFQIEAGTGKLTVYNLPKGEHTYYLQFSHPDICNLVEKAVGTVNPGIVADVVAKGEVCLGDAKGSILISNVTGGSGIYEFSLDNSTWVGINLFENLPAANYTVYIRDIGGQYPCLLVRNVQVQAPQGNIQINNDVVLIDASCDLPNGSISNIQISGGWGNYSVKWRKDSSTGPPITGNQTGAANLLPGQYFLLVTDGEGCKAEFSFLIKELPKPDFDAVVPLDICTLEDITLTVFNTIANASSTDFTWSKSPNQANPVTLGPDPVINGVQYAIREVLDNIYLDISGLPAGTYTYYFTVGCTGQEIPISFTVNPLPEPTFGSKDLSCHNTDDGQIFVTGGGTDLTFSIDGKEFIDKAALEISRFPEGTYTIKAKNSNGCISEEQTLTINKPDLLEITLIESKNATCGLDDGFVSLALKGGIAPYTLTLFKNGVLVQTVTTEDAVYTFANLGSGEFRVLLTETNACEAELTGPVTLIEDPTEIVIQELFEICEGELVELKPSLNPSAANPVYTYYWNAPIAGNEISHNQILGTALFEISNTGQLKISGLESGPMASVWVSVAGPDICEGDLKEVKIRVESTPAFTVTKTDENCFGEGGSIKINPEKNINNVTYSLNGGNFQSYTGNLISGLVPGTYSLTAKSQFGCLFPLADPFVILGPTAKLEITDLILKDATCGAKDGTLTARISGGTVDYSLIIRDVAGNPLLGPITFPTGDILVDNLSPGAYVLQIVDAKGCLKSVNGLVVGESPTVIQANEEFICEGTMATLTPTINHGGADPVYNWYYDKNLINPVQVSNTPDQFGATYNFLPSGAVQITGLKGQSQPYGYFVAVTGNRICNPEPKEVKVTVQRLPNLEVLNPSIVCDPNETVDLTQFILGYNTNVFDYIVTHPDGYEMRLDNISSVSNAGTYEVEASMKGMNCWTASGKIVVIYALTQLIADFQYEIKIDGQEYVNSDVLMEDTINFRDISQGNVIIWNWDFGDGNFSSLQNPSHRYDKAGTYTIRLSTYDNFGCPGVIEKSLHVSNNYLIIIPNAFSPDQPKNKYFMPKHRGIAAMKLYIFNSWGDLLFETESLEGPGWDGTLQGQKTPNGNYVYRALFTSRSGEKIDRAGVFTLIR